MNTVNIFRFIDNTKQSLGNLTVDYNLFEAKTLELPWKENQHNISCIPVNDESNPFYICKWTRSNRLSILAGHDVFTYEVINVPDRDGIRLHSANYFFQLLGCIALGDVLKDINIDGQLDTEHSGNTIKKLNELMNKQDFKLIIKNQISL